MSAITVHPADSSPDGGTPPVGTPEVRLLPPGAVPEGAVVLGVLVAVPTGRSQARTRPVGSVTPVLQPVASPDPDDIMPLGLGLQLDRWRREFTRDQHPIDLTRREFDLLEHLVTHPGRAFSRTELLTAVWDIEDTRYAPARTVDVHVSRVRRKLGARHAANLESLRGVGYRWTGRVGTAIHGCVRAAGE